MKDSNKWKEQMARKKDLEIKRSLGLDENDGYVKLADLARFLGLTTEALRYWVKSGKLKAEKIGGVYFVKKSDIEALETLKKWEGKEEVKEESKKELSREEKIEALKNKIKKIKQDMKREEEKKLYKAKLFCFEALARSNNKDLLAILNSDPSIFRDTTTFYNKKTKRTETRVVDYYPVLKKYLEDIAIAIAKAQNPNPNQSQNQSQNPKLKPSQLYPKLKLKPPQL